MMQHEIDLLEADLVRLGQAIAFPPAPALSRTVAQRLVARPLRAERASRWQLAGVAMAAAIVIAALFAGTVSPARDAVADLLDRINIFQTAESPAGLPTDITGKSVTVEQAEMRLGFPILLPAYPEKLEPEQVLFQEFGRVKAVALFFRPSEAAPFVLFETNGFVGKGLPVGGSAQAVNDLGDGDAFWLEGLRIVQYYDQQGNVIEESRRATDVNTLLWQQGGLVFRIEGDLSRDEAVRIAKSLL